MFGAILGKYDEEESQELQSEMAIEEDSIEYPYIDYRSNLPLFLKNDEVILNQDEKEQRLREMTEYSNLKFVLLPDDYFRLFWDIIILM